MKKIKLIIWSLLLSVACLNCFSQYRKNAIVLELAGKSFGFFDISYERSLSRKFHIGGGIGMSRKYHLYYDGGMFTRHNLRFPLYCGYAIGQKKHHAIAEIGTTIRVFTGPEDPFTFDGQDLFISAGYEYKGEKFFFRAPVYLVRMGSNELSVFVPWFGLSLGTQF
jgi:hypothetical protein